MVTGGRSEDIPNLLKEYKRHHELKCIFAERTRRSEGFLFIFSHLYQILHYLLTGRKIRFGNFSVISFDILKRLIVVPEL
jgi:hypothetical protein